ncbi:MAG: type II toxin-antitoxin system RelE/ParE family toxin [Marinospirillum sp.]|uniref:type II toxin-antitoxin system RelE/ParE family toxin n=1 Tax=Marinospirillum sp. TaxID=2183934 RepID=UPI0019DDC942|nr:type II toxin-antitoxin system RelE/ParE family toxin [Marinospirillum sp.]MBE0507948.1 type II toxin-antitoxin system RelE/ParE family toxin [Marinospirillum sp.]
MKVSFLDLAQQELDDVFDYYEAEQQGLGKRFISEVTATLARIKDFPEAYQYIGTRTRRALVGHFPYGVLYHYKKETQVILILAIAHLHRNPDYWLSRKI